MHPLLIPIFNPDVQRPSEACVQDAKKPAMPRSSSVYSGNFADALSDYSTLPGVCTPKFISTT